MILLEEGILLLFVIDQLYLLVVKDNYHYMEGKWFIIVRKQEGM